MHRLELLALYNSDYLVCDGTFETSPDSSCQLYTIHDYIRGEGVPLVWVLLPNKTQTTYAELFKALHDAVVAAFSDVGRRRTFLTDFEAAAIHALQVTFPESTMKGCSFHFRQAVLRRVQREGLLTAYEDVNSPL